jgi:hypothetical protein
VKKVQWPITSRSSGCNLSIPTTIYLHILSSMLAPRSSSAFICIRCELRHRRLHFAALAVRHPRAQFSISPRYRDDDKEPSRAQDLQTIQPRHLKIRPSLDQEHSSERRRKAALRKTTERLEGGVKTLGTDSSILVLREVSERGSEERGSEVHTSSEADAPASLGAVNIAESLQEEYKPITKEEIHKQLESLRPRSDADPLESHYISQSRFIALSQQLLQGFTAQQLSQYYSVIKGINQKQVGKKVFDGIKELQRKAERPAERSEWHPGTTQIERRLPGLDVHHKPKQRKPISKHLLVDQILRDLWELTLLEEIEAPGELELSLKPWQLSLLDTGCTPSHLPMTVEALTDSFTANNSPLSQIASDRKVKVEIHWPHNVLRVTADKATAEYAADDIESLLQKAHSHKFQIKPWLPYLDSNGTPDAFRAIYSEQTLNVVSSMTKTLIHFGGNDEVRYHSLLIINC